MARTYLIDGHNLIGQGVIPGIHLDMEDDEMQLTAWLRARKSYLPGKMVVIFDGGVPGGASNELTGGGVTAIFAAQKRSSADELIRRRTFTSGSPKSLIVVTNDIGLRRSLRAAGVKIIGAREFVALIEQNKRKIAEARVRSQKEKPRLSQQELKEWMEMFGVGRDGD